MTRQGRQWLGRRDAIQRSADSRQFVDEILSELSLNNFGPLAWGHFIGRSLARSVAQVRIRPAAATEVTLLHSLASLRPKWWAFGSWLLCITHLGLLGERSTLGWPNRLTLLRGLLPSLAPNSRWTSLVAMATDFADGHMARSGALSAFGAYADPIADGVFWSWFALRWEPNRWLRWAPLTAFAVTAGAISAVYFARGRSIDYPRLVAIPYASAAAQLALTLRAFRSVVR